MVNGIHGVIDVVTWDLIFNNEKQAPLCWRQSMPNKLCINDGFCASALCLCHNLFVLVGDIT